MTDEDNLATILTNEILKDPAVVLDNPKVMQALLEITDNSKGHNVLDLRAIFAARLEERMKRLEDTNRTVIAAAYENLTGTNQMHRTVVALLGAETLPQFVQVLNHDVANILGVDVVRFCVEGEKPHGITLVDRADQRSGTMVVLPNGGAANYITDQRNGPAPRQITLRRASEQRTTVFGILSADIASEAVIRLEISQDIRGLVVFGSSDPKRFASDQGTELLVFFAQTVERILRRWLT